MKDKLRWLLSLSNFTRIFEIGINTCSDRGRYKVKHSQKQIRSNNSRRSCTAIMLLESYTSVSRLINTEPSELLRLRLSEPIASESVATMGRMQVNYI